MQSDDGELVKRARAGDSAAYTSLVLRYRDAVCGIAFHHLRNGEDAQDAAQETFIQAYLHLSELRDPQFFAPWLRRMTVNRCLDRLRQRSRENAHFREETDSLNTGRFRLPADDRDNLADVLSRRLLLRHALDSLSDKVRLTVTLCYIGEYSHDEIARFLDIPRDTVRSRLRHAKRQLREEMKTMADEVLGEARPGPDWTRQVVEEAMRRGQEALERHATGDAILAFDAALGKLDAGLITEEKQRLLLDVLRHKDAAVGMSAGREARIDLLTRALAAARALHDSAAEAEILQDMGIAERDLVNAVPHYKAALTLFRLISDTRRQAECLLYIGVAEMFQNNGAAGRDAVNAALPLFEKAGARDWQGVCHALLETLSETNAIGLENLLLWAGMCDGLETTEGKLRFTNQPGFQLTRRGEEHPGVLFVGSVFWQISALGTFLDTGAAAGGGWSGDVRSFSYQPLKAEMRVVSAAEHVRVPAGDFDHCLLMELSTSENTAPDDAPEQRRLLNRTLLCGRRRAWFAPGVGLVRLHVEPTEGPEAQIELQTYSVITASNTNDAPLPLAIGNAWTYGWGHIPQAYTARESYRVTGQTRDHWHLSHAAWVYKNG